MGNRASSREASGSHDKSVASELPTAVTVKPVLSLVKAHLEHDDSGFKNAALEIAHELELNNKEELARYIYAQYGLVRTFEAAD